ncbi:DUF3086 domain-containing protein [Synechococcus sp. BSF8S]|uniref:DUF3086 domain-containing protein n=1 Tax=unclassified Synechococcus TaxID=2626047 RepID=UPI00162824C9|nr:MULTISPECIES: DUF3086 domain-containing protein [unclassified Synechococcus]MBC1262329.1 DUF3086 domain-containing protein [Synechococcus sp. BSF8S]MBC1265232.1 DUF3086 domain-containing protein [Synechococcus sp. BSA11S]
MSDSTPTTPPEAVAESPPEQGGERKALMELALIDLRERRAALLAEIEALEQRRKQLEQDLDGTLSGRADGIARRLKGFQDYLVVALQDLAGQAELMDLVVQPLQVQPSPLDPAPEAMPTASPVVQQSPPAAAGQFSQDAELIRDRLALFQGQPDFYADPWKLRRSLEPAAAALLDDWFLNQGGRGAQASSGSRNRNALITAGAVAILGDLYGDRFQTLVLAGEPERLGEWRRGLQDCLGLAKEDFGPNSGIVLFERPDALIERADRLEERGELPFIVVDAAEQVVDIPVLQFPLWLAFAAAPDELALEQDLA